MLRKSIRKVKESINHDGQQQQQLNNHQHHHHHHHHHNPGSSNLSVNFVAGSNHVANGSGRHSPKVQHRKAKNRSESDGKHQKQVQIQPEQPKKKFDYIVHSKMKIAKYRVLRIVIDNFLQCILVMSLLQN